MSITVKYFASMKDYLGRSEDIIDYDNITTIDDVWIRIAQDKKRPPNTLAAINLEFASFQHSVKDGDEVAFFPPVTGG